MIVQSGFLIPGIAGTPYCVPQCCKYTVNVANFGSDEDDDPFFLVGVQTASGLVTFPNNDEPDMRNYVLLEDALNALGIGIYRVMPIQDDRIQITSEDNPNSLVGIRVRIEGDTHDIPFYECDCHTLPVCEEGVEKCTFHLFRKFETSNNDKIRFSSIKFVNTTPYTIQQKIDAQDYKKIAIFINSLAEADGKFEAINTNNTLILQAKSLKYKPEYVEWEFETATFNGGTEKKYKKTYFVKSDCYSQCCCCCGGENQPPCKNNNSNSGCNTPLELHLDGLCRPACTSGHALVAGTWVPAGNAGQPVDCKGQCFGDLVPTNYGCQPKSQKATVCTLAFVVKTNPNEKLVNITFGSLGLFTPPTPIIFGTPPAGLPTQILTWLNAPETGLCPAGYNPCVSATAVPVPNSPLVTYSFILNGVNIDVTNTKDPIVTTTQFEGEYDTYVLPVGQCSETDLDLTCPHGQIFNINFARCVELTKADWCKNFTPNAIGNAVPCHEYRPPTTDEYDRAKEALIQGAIINIQAQFNEQVVRWFATRGLATDYRGYAIHLLIMQGKLPEWEAICYQTAQGKIEI